MKHYFMTLPDGICIADDGAESIDVRFRLQGTRPTCLAADHQAPNRIYCGTDGQGLWISDDGGRTWRSALADLPASVITSLAVSPARAGSGAMLFAGTENSSVFRSADGGDSWLELQSIRNLQSYSTWSFPPFPSTHNVRSLAEDVHYGDLFASIEAGAVISSRNGGDIWTDTKPDRPLDAHTLLTHPLAPGTIYAACSDGVERPGRSVLVSRDRGDSWHPCSKGLEHRYLFDMTASIAYPELLLVSASASAADAYVLEHSASFIYRKEGQGDWQLITAGLPPGEGTLISNLAADPLDPDGFYAFNNHGLFHSADKGLAWKELPIAGLEALQYREPGRRHRSALLVTATP